MTKIKLAISLLLFAYSTYSLAELSANPSVTSSDFYARPVYLYGHLNSAQSGYTSLDYITVRRNFYGDFIIQGQGRNSGASFISCLITTTDALFTQATNVMQTATAHTRISVSAPYSWGRCTSISASTHSAYAK